jgi:hypothetical protein
MGDLEDFTRDFLPRFMESQRAFHDGDAEPNIALWTATDPVTLLAGRAVHRHADHQPPNSPPTT